MPACLSCLSVRQALPASRIEPQDEVKTEDNQLALRAPLMYREGADKCVNAVSESWREWVVQSLVPRCSYAGASCVDEDHNGKSNASIYRGFRTFAKLATATCISKAMLRLVLCLPGPPSCSLTFRTYELYSVPPAFSLPVRTLLPDKKRRQFSRFLMRDAERSLRIHHSCTYGPIQVSTCFQRSHRLPVWVGASQVRLWSVTLWLLVSTTPTPIILRTHFPANRADCTQSGGAARWRHAFRFLNTPGAARPGGRGVSPSGPSAEPTVEMALRTDARGNTPDACAS